VGECFFWYWPTRVVLDQRPLNDCVCVCVYITMDVMNIQHSIVNMHDICCDTDWGLAGPGCEK